MPIPDQNSFNHIVLNTVESEPALSVRATMSSFYNSTHATDERYDIVREGGDPIKTKRLVNLIFDENPQVTAKRRAVIGDMTREEFDRRFQSGRELYEGKLMHLALLFAAKSFPETFFHPQIARALVATGLLTNPNTAEARILETGMVILSALEKKEGLAIMLGMGRSHDRRSRELYNADTVEFTLLTFSYFGAKVSNMKEDDWFFYWRVFGSMMGLPPDRLHHNYEEARVRMKALHLQCDGAPSEHSRRLLETFRSLFLGDEATIREACQKNHVSKRMERYLREGGHWPVALANRHSE